MNAGFGRFGLTLFATLAAAAMVASVIPPSGRAQQGTVPIFLKEKPAGYRDWTVISESHEAATSTASGPF
jgi:hypothetical protein